MPGAASEVERSLPLEFACFDDEGVEVGAGTVDRAHDVGGGDGAELSLDSFGGVR
jgi:hypothetical protein